jgi:hypothetical protein
VELAKTTTKKESARRCSARSVTSPVKSAKADMKREEEKEGKQRTAGRGIGARKAEALPLAVLRCRGDVQAILWSSAKQLFDFNKAPKMRVSVH